MSRQAAIEAVELLFEMDVLTDHEYGFSAEDVVDAVLKAEGVSHEKWCNIYKDIGGCSCTQEDT
jgi:hypothetical protein